MASKDRGDEDEDEAGALYENGHWVWDDHNETLVFVKELQPLKVESELVTLLPTGSIEFREDVDLLEQIRYRRRYQRKLLPGEGDVVTVQDIKDLVLYTAPHKYLSSSLINLLHLPSTERLIRALILYCQYYLQVSDELTLRHLELDRKLRLPESKRIENEYRENLMDLRILVAKEYLEIISGGEETKKFHHMGPQKKLQSLSKKDAQLFETLLCMCVQIVWLALGRKAHNLIKVEINRLFKTDLFNAAEHSLQTDCYAKMPKDKRSVLIGSCGKNDGKLKMKSYLMYDILCSRKYDYRMLGLGVIKYRHLPTRLLYLRIALASPEEDLKKNDVTLGILGMPRSKFDTLLQPIIVPEESTHGRGSMSSRSSQSGSSGSAKSAGTMKRSQLGLKIYPKIVLPTKQDEEYLSPEFEYESEKIRPCSEIQRRRWQVRFMKLRHSTPRPHKNY